MKTMNKTLRILGVIAAVLFVFSYPKNADAISNNCKNSSLYETSFSITPTSGLRDTEIEVTMKFRWNGFAYQACLGTKLNFDLSWGIVGSTFSSDIDEYPIGIVGENWVTKTTKVSVATFPGVSGGPANTGQGEIWLGMMVEDSDWNGLGDNLFDPIKKEYTISVGNRICAFVAPDSRYSCIHGSETVSDCATLSECNGQSCTKIDSSLCGSSAKIWACIADDNRYACSNGNKSDLSDTPACSGKTPIQIDPNKCSQSAGGGTTTPGGGTTTPTSGGASGTYQYQITNPLAGGPQSPFDIINIASQWLFNISIPLAVMFILYAGFLMLTAGPRPDNVKKAKEIIWNVVLALAIIFIGRGFISLIYSVIQLGG
jgi:hypothetical protein